MSILIKKLFFRKEVVVVVMAVVLTTVGIKASDSLKSKNNDNNNGCPEDMVFVSSATGGFCIDIFEASASEKCAYAQEFNVDKTRANLKQSDCSAASVVGAYPWIYISKDQAALACAKAGKRLPSPKEWYLASLGTPDIERGWSADDCNVSSNWALNPGLTGSGEICVSSAGAYDMIGNIWEWVDGVVVDSKYENVELPSKGYVGGLGIDSLAATTEERGNIDYNHDYFWIKGNGVRAIARGGNWINKSDAGQYSVYAEADTNFIGKGIGFRCAK